MSDERTGRELTPRPDEPTSAVTPRESDLPTKPISAVGERFAAGEQAHTVGLTEERAAKIVKQSGNARMIAFLGVLFVVLFIPVYWLYDIGLPVIGDQGRLANDAQEQQVTDISQGYALFLANCARCHGTSGEGGIGPPLNDQGKLFNTVTAAGAPGPGHLNPNYLLNVLTVGGRYVCGDPNSVMPVWAQPNGPLNYLQVQQIIDWITASKDTSFTYQPAAAEAGAGASVPAPTLITGWRDPGYTPPPDATPVPACWRGDNSGAAASSAPSLAPVASPGTAANPREIDVEGTDQLKWVDPTSGQQISQLAVVPGEVIEFKVDVNSAVAHSFHIGLASDLSTATEPNDLPGIAQFANGTQTYTYTVPSTLDNTQFACTVPGHYQSGMHVDLIPESGGAAGSPAASVAPGQSAAPSGSAAPVGSVQPSGSAAPQPSPAPSAAPSAAPS